MPSPALFPAFVGQYSVAFDANEPTDLALQFPGIALPPSMDRAVRKRKAEFLAARYCAREVLRSLAPEHADALVGSGPHREPLWPAEIVGSITHTHGFASVALARRSDCRGVGLDVERVVPDDRAERLLEHIARRDEVERLVCATGWSRGLVFTLVFSAKESIFKCLYPEVRRYFDFLEAEVIALDPAAGRFSARLLVALAPALPAGYVVEGTFVADPASVLVSTGVVLAP